MDTGAGEHALELRHAAEELFVLVVVAKPHDLLDARAVVPAAVEQHDFAGRRQVRDVTLEVPLGLFAVIRRRQGGNPADPGVQALGDALDHATFAGGITPFEQNHHFVAGLHHPALQFHQFALQAEQFAEINPARCFFAAFTDVLVEQRVQVMPVFGQFQFQLFITVIKQFTADALHQGVFY